VSYAGRVSAAVRVVVIDERGVNAEWVADFEPRRTGAISVDEALAVDEDVVRGWVEEAPKPSSCTSANVVVTGVSASAVIPDHLQPYREL